MLNYTYVVFTIFFYLSTDTTQVNSAPARDDWLARR